MTWKDLERRDGDHPWREPRPIGGVVGRLTARWHLGDPRVHAVVFTHWPDLVGEVIAARVRPVQVRDGVLRVEADDASWATELRFFAPRIVERIEERSGVARTETGGVRELSVQLARAPGRRRPEA